MKEEGVGKGPLVPESTHPSKASSSSWPIARDPPPDGLERPDAHGECHCPCDSHPLPLKPEHSSPQTCLRRAGIPGGAKVFTMVDEGAASTSGTKEKVARCEINLAPSLSTTPSPPNLTSPLLANAGADSKADLDRCGYKLCDFLRQWPTLIF